MADPFEDELKALEAIFREYSGQFLEISRELIQEKYTVHPIFVAFKAPVQIGEVLLDAAEYEIPYSINVATLEEFLETGLIQSDRVESFKTAFGDPIKAMCVFWIVGENARYILIPFGGRNSDNPA
jgi:hypothetical protein